MTSVAIDTVSRNDLLWSVRQNSDDRIGPGPHEEGLSDFLLHFVSETSTFLDVGAHVGHYALRLAAHCSSVIAIEPNPQARSALVANIDLNDLTNVMVCGAAAHRRAEALRLWDPFDVTGGSCTRTLGPSEVSPRPAGYGISTLFFGGRRFGRYLGMVNAETIDAIVGVHERVSLMKVDVEGNEGNVLAGARATIQRNQPSILIEMHHDMYGEDVWLSVVEQLGELNYLWDVLSLRREANSFSSGKCDFIFAEPDSRKFNGRPR